MIAAVLILASVAQGATPPPGPNLVDGWRNTTWGMTQAEVLRALGSEGVLLKRPESFGDGRLARVVIPALKIGSRVYRAHFIFTGTPPTLATVQINAHRVDDALQRFDDLLQQLTAKYGQPYHTRREKNFRLAAWRLDKTEIELRATSTFRSVMLGYNPRSTNENL